MCLVLSVIVILCCTIVSAERLARNQNGDVVFLCNLRAAVPMLATTYGWPDPCGWAAPCDAPLDGVECHPAPNNNRIKSITQTGRGLVGTIPVSLWYVNKLVKLQLSNNSLSGTLPDMMSPTSYMPEFAFIHIGKNRFSGTIPTAYTTLPALKTFEAENNLFDGAVPGALSPSIKLVNISSNLLSGTIPVTIGAATTLTALSLSNNMLIGTLPSSMASLTRLEVLTLDSNRLSGTIPAGFAALTGLTALNLGTNSLAGTLPDMFSSPALATVVLSHTNVVGTIPPSLGSATTLVHLDISRTCLSGALTAQITPGGTCLADWTGITTFPAGCTYDGAPASFRAACCANAPQQVCTGQPSTCAWCDLGATCVEAPWTSNCLCDAVSVCKAGKTFLCDLFNTGNPLYWSSYPCDITSPLALHRTGTNGPPGEITDLFLVNIYFRGLPESIAGLPTLTSLMIKDTAGIEVLPPYIGSIHSLKRLTIINNPSMTAFPNELGSLTALTSLEIVNHPLITTLPSTLSSLTNLMRLAISDSCIGSIPPGMTTSLQTCELTNTGVSAANAPSACTVYGTMSRTCCTRVQQDVCAENPMSCNLCDGICYDFHDPSCYNPLALNPQVRFLCDMYRMNTHVRTMWGPSPCTWVLPDGPCKLYLFGISCSNNDIYSVEMPLSNLPGTIPESIGELTALVTLNLNYNYISGTIPSGIVSLTSLNVFDISYNRISGAIPQFSATQLMTINLGYNSLTGTIPESLGALPRLSSLRINNNALVGGIPENIATHTRLAILSVATNALVDTLEPHHFVSPTLAYANMSRNGLFGTLPVTCFAYTSTLDLGYNSLSGSIPPMNTRSEIYLNDNLFTGTLPRVTTSYTFNRLSVANNRLSGTITQDFYVYAYGNFSHNMFTIYNVSTIPSILDLSHNMISNSLSYILSSTNLASAYLNDNLFFGEIPARASNYNLRYLDVSNNYLVGDVTNLFSMFNYMYGTILSDNCLSGSFRPAATLISCNVSNTSITSYPDGCVHDPGTMSDGFSESCCSGATRDICLQHSELCAWCSVGGGCAPKSRVNTNTQCICTSDSDCPSSILRCNTAGYCTPCPEPLRYLVVDGVGMCTRIGYSCSPPTGGYCWSTYTDYQNCISGRSFLITQFSDSSISCACVPTFYREIGSQCYSLVNAVQKTYCNASGVCSEDGSPCSVTQLPGAAPCGPLASFVAHTADLSCPTSAISCKTGHYDHGMCIPHTMVNLSACSCTAATNLPLGSPCLASAVCAAGLVCTARVCSCPPGTLVVDIPLPSGLAQGAEAAVSCLAPGASCSPVACCQDCASPRVVADPANPARGACACITDISAQCHFYDTIPGICLPDGSCAQCVSDSDCTGTASCNTVAHSCICDAPSGTSVVYKQSVGCVFPGSVCSPQSCAAPESLSAIASCIRPPRCIYNMSGDCELSIDFVLQEHTLHTIPVRDPDSGRAWCARQRRDSPCWSAPLNISSLATSASPIRASCAARLLSVKASAASSDTECRAIADCDGNPCTVETLNELQSGTTNVCVPDDHRPPTMIGGPVCHMSSFPVPCGHAGSCGFDADSDVLIIGPHDTARADHHGNHATATSTAVGWTVNVHTLSTEPQTSVRMAAILESSVASGFCSVSVLGRSQTQLHIVGAIPATLLDIGSIWEDGISAPIVVSCHSSVAAVAVFGSRTCADDSHCTNFDGAGHGINFCTSGQCVFGAAGNAGLDALLVASRGACDTSCIPCYGIPAHIENAVGQSPDAVHLAQRAAAALSIGAPECAACGKCLIAQLVQDTPSGCFSPAIKFVFDDHIRPTDTRCNDKNPCTVDVFDPVDNICRNIPPPFSDTILSVELGCSSVRCVNGTPVSPPLSVSSGWPETGVPCPEFFSADPLVAQTAPLKQSYRCHHGACISVGLSTRD